MGRSLECCISNDCIVRGTAGLKTDRYTYTQAESLHLSALVIIAIGCVVPSLLLVQYFKSASSPLAGLQKYWKID